MSKQDETASPSASGGVEGYAAERKTIAPEAMVEIYNEVMWNSFIKGRRVRYINTCFDARTGDIFTLRFRLNGSKEVKEFTVVNRREEGEIDLYDEVMTWLVEGRGK